MIQLYLLISSPWKHYPNAATASEFVPQLHQASLPAAARGAGVAATTHPGGASSGQWSPDGVWIYFIAARGGGDEATPQLYLIRAAGGEAVQLIAAPRGVTSYAWQKKCFSVCEIFLLSVCTILEVKIFHILKNTFFAW